MNITEFLKKSFSIRRMGSFEMADIRPHIVCNDGFTMSVQASKSHYCSPREDNAIYTSVEVGFPSENEKLLDEYSDGYDEVYSGVPINIIDDIIESHDGINCKQTFKKRS